MAPTTRSQSPERGQPSNSANPPYPVLPTPTLAPDSSVGDLSTVLEEIRRLREENEQLITENGELNAQAQKDWDTLHPDLSSASPETTANQATPATTQAQDTALQTLVRALENLRTPGVTHQSSAKALSDPRPLTDGTDPEYESWESRIRNKLASNIKDYSTKPLKIAYI